MVSEKKIEEEEEQGVDDEKVAWFIRIWRYSKEQILIFIKEGGEGDW